MNPARIEPASAIAAGPPHRSVERPIRKGGGVYKIGLPYKIGTRLYVPTADPTYDRIGLASWYGQDFHGRETANGEIFDMNALTAAHPTLPLPSYAYVTNLSSNRTILVRINDRGPYVNDRIIDLSLRSARELGFASEGITKVRVAYAGRAPLNGSNAHELRYLAAQRNSGAIAGPPVTYQRLIDRSIATTAPPPEPATATSPIPSGLTWRR